MLLTLCCINGRNAMGDSYKNIVNNFTCKHKIIVLVPNDYEKNEFDPEFFEKLQDNFSNNSTKSKYILGFKFALKIRKIVSTYNVNNIFIYFDNSWFNLFLFWLLRDHKRKYYIWIHDPELHLGENRKAYLIRFLMSKMVFPQAVGFFSSFSNGAINLIEKYNIPAEKIKVVWLPEMIELQFAELRATEEAMKQYDYDFIFFGRLEKYKGLDLLFEAIRILNGKGEKIRLLVVGKGVCDEQVRECINGLENITFINSYVDNRELANFIIKSRCVILPYISATGSQTVQVANYYNKPVLATRVGCFNEYINEGVNGLFIEEASPESIAEAIEHISGEEQYQQIKCQIKGYFEDNFVIEKTVQCLETTIFRR